jgi:stage V sporulation protein G
MEITEITVSIRDEDKLKAFVNVTFDDCFVVRGMKVIKGATGYFVSMPSRKMTDGTYRDIAHPITNEFRDQVEKSILAAYKEELRRNGKEPDPDLVV